MSTRMPALELSVSLGKLRLKNPVMVASGTFGYAQEFADFIDLSKLGAVVTKTITLGSRRGNPSPRTCETPAGMLNSIGLENPGLEEFVREKLPYLRSLGVPLIVSIAAESSAGEFVALAKRLNALKEVAALELNISCPNVKTDASGRRIAAAPLIAQDSRATYEVVSAVRAVTGKTLITKLSPNVADIVPIAQAAERAGTDAVALINTVSGMCIDVETRRPKLAAGAGGLSGPAIRPIAVRMVWEAYNKISVPIVGMGGIMDAASAMEFIIAGATAVSVGTANFINPRAAAEIIDGIAAYVVRQGRSSVRAFIGSGQS